MAEFGCAIVCATSLASDELKHWLATNCAGAWDILSTQPDARDPAGVVTKYEIFIADRRDRESFARAFGASVAGARMCRNCPIPS